jgi:hypothetical protein
MSRISDLAATSASDIIASLDVKTPWPIGVSVRTEVDVSNARDRIGFVSAEACSSK